MEGQELKDGKERVRTVLIDPLVRRGMVRKRGRTVEAHEAMLTSLEARLAYMHTDQLAALAEVVERHAEGDAKNVWPAEVSICNWARALQEPPPSDSRLIVSMLQSEAGRRARDGGYLVELYGYLKKFGRPPNDFAYDQIKRKAQENARRQTRLRENAEAGRMIDPDDQRWQDAYGEARARCIAIIEAKVSEDAA